MEQTPRTPLVCGAATGYYYDTLLQHAAQCLVAVLAWVALYTATPVVIYKGARHGSQ